MREIKFRAWDEANKKYIEWHDFSIVFDSDSLYELLCGNIKNFILEQFTGLRDKNGREIYEGDVITSAISRAHQEELGCSITGVVNYEPCLGSYDITSIFDDEDFCKFSEIDEFNIFVIGNIHEKPELLESK
jgi:uncharacterized phage protein (TIGR01671 family)